MKNFVFILLFLAISCRPTNTDNYGDLASTADGWHAEVIATIDQSYGGWDVEIGDADNDGENEILITGCPESKLAIIKKLNKKWALNILAENLAQTQPDPGMGLAVKVVDLNNDGENEIILGTGQERGGTAWFYLLQTDGEKLTQKFSYQADCNTSSFTHNLAVCDLDGDGIKEVISAYCGGGEIIRYDIDQDLNHIDSRKLHQLSGSGEESIIADVDNDGQYEYLTSNSFREKAAKVEIYEFDETGELLLPARIVLDGFDGRGCFYASLTVGDVDNDGLNELIVGWKEDQKINKGTVLGYKVDSIAHEVYTFAHQDETLDLSYFEKMMEIADADNDGRNELVLSTRGDNISEFITSDHLGYVLMFKVDNHGAVNRELLVDLNEKYAESSWLAVGDADNDGKNEIVLATGKGDRTLPGISHVILVEKD
ncbi:MAG: VCBS repeat-containing protein [Bacteroidota bacterium]|nr:VCBS repeat-containing protein [Bacteroidota bacterium]